MCISIDRPEREVVHANQYGGLVRDKHGLWNVDLISRKCSCERFLCNHFVAVQDYLRRRENKAAQVMDSSVNRMETDNLIRNDYSTELV